MSENEYLTRKSRIDPKLRAAGWDVVPYNEGRSLSAYDRCAIEEYPTENGPTDYALCVNGSILAIIEAKKVSLGPQSVLVQAERYARGITDTPFNFDGIRVPFLYATNGKVIWYHDARNPLNRSREIAAFHSPDALLDRLQIDTDRACSQFFTLLDNPRMRPYQREACNAIGNAIVQRQRAMLVAMATGTMRQSILAQVFSGRLVPTEAELARRDGREYEPASVLLERIRSEMMEKTGRRGVQSTLV